MGALIQPDTFLIVSLDEGEIEEKTGEHSRATGKGKEGTTTCAETGTWVSGANICTHLDFNITLEKHVFVERYLEMSLKGVWGYLLFNNLATVTDDSLCFLFVF